MTSASPPGWRFSLRQLLLLITVFGLLIIPVKLIGLPAVHAVIAVWVFLIPFFWRPRWLYLWILPLVWIPTAFRNMEHHGDEYGGFLIGSLAGFWIAPLISWLSINDPKQIMPVVVLAGGLSMIAMGALLDRLRLPWACWFSLWVIASVWMFASWFGGFPSVARALAKNGSYDTYVVTSINFGLTVATVFGLGGVILYRLAVWAPRQDGRLTMRIGLVQFKSSPGDVAQNLDRHVTVIAGAAHVDLVIFPELSLTGYTPPLAERLAPQLHAHVLEALEPVCAEHQVIAAAGLPTVVAGGICISTLFVFPNRTHGVYSKQFVHETEEPFFVQGLGTPTIKVGGVTMGYGICYELSVDRHVAAAGAAGAELYVASTAKPEEDLDVAHERMATIATRLGTPAMICNGLGEGILGGGRSAIWDRQGNLLAALDGDREGMLTFDTNLGTATATHH